MTQRFSVWTTRSLSLLNSHNNTRRILLDIHFYQVTEPLICTRGGGCNRCPSGPAASATMTKGHVHEGDNRHVAIVPTIINITRTRVNSSFNCLSHFSSYRFRAHTFVRLETCDCQAPWEKHHLSISSLDGIISPPSPPIQHPPRYSSSAWPGAHSSYSCE